MASRLGFLTEVVKADCNKWIAASSGCRPSLTRTSKIVNGKACFLHLMRGRANECRIWCGFRRPKGHLDDCKTNSNAWERHRPHNIECRDGSPVVRGFRSARLSRLRPHVFSLAIRSNACRRLAQHASRHHYQCVLCCDKLPDVCCCRLTFACVHSLDQSSACGKRDARTDQKHSDRGGCGPYRCLRVFAGCLCANGQFGSSSDKTGRLLRVARSMVCVTSGCPVGRVLATITCTAQSRGWNGKGVSMGCHRWYRVRHPVGHSTLGHVSGLHDDTVCRFIRSHNGHLFRLLCLAHGTEILE